jgi:hypothetical protein
MQDKNNWVSFYLVDNKKTIAASCHFHLVGKIASSPNLAPHGGLEFTSRLSAKAIFEFLIFAEASLKEKGITEIRIKNPSEAHYGPRGNLVTVMMLNLGYTISCAESTAVLFVNSPFLETKVDNSEKRKLDKASKNGFEYKQLPLTDFVKAYRFIDKCRKVKGYELSMTEKQLHETIEKFPKRYVIFGLFDKTRLICASITVRIKENILYLFYGDHDPEFDSLSPMVLLTARIFEYCRLHKIEQLDLGTSSLKGKPNFKLLDFKLRLGAVPSPKFTMVKTLK